MYIFTNGYPEIRIKLDNGVYIFDAKSSTGKTYLAILLKRLRGAGEPVDSFTYADSKRVNTLTEALSGKDFTVQQLRVIMLDRYDMYSDLYVDELDKLRENCVILIDCKWGARIRNTRRCYATLTSDSIEVTPGALYL